MLLFFVWRHYHACAPCLSATAGAAALVVDNRKCRGKNPETIYNCIILQYKYSNSFQRPTNDGTTLKRKVENNRVCEWVCACACVTHKNWQIRATFFFSVSIFPTNFCCCCWNISLSLAYNIWSGRDKAKQHRTAHIQCDWLTQFVWIFVMCKFDLICLPLSQTMS